MSQRSCPVCTTPLCLKQISFTKAVYICDNMQCPYPVGFKCTMIERKFEDMNKAIQTSSEPAELDDWINQVISGGGEKTAQLGTNVTEEDFSEILKFLDNDATPPSN